MNQDILRHPFHIKCMRCVSQRKMHQHAVTALILMLLIPKQSSAQLLDSSAALVTALDNNVAAVDRMTASNERVVGKLESSIDKIVDSNDKNVEQLVDTSDKLISKWDTSVGPSIQNALSTWDKSLKPQVVRVADIGQGALNRWDESMQPRVDHALKTFDDTLKVVNTSIIGRLDDYASYGKTVFIPLFLGFGTLWSFMCCCIMPISCFFWTRKLRKAEIAMMKRTQSYDEDSPKKMLSQFLL